MDFSSIMAPLFSFLVALPVVGPYVGAGLVFVLKFALPLVGIATAFVALWHGLILFLKALGAFPYLSGLNKVADQLHASEDRVAGIVGDDIVPFLNRLSALPLPKLPAQAQPQPQAPAQK